MAATATSTANDPTSRALQDGVDKAINEAGTRYVPLEYKYNEVLLEILDKVEAYLSGKTKEPPPRYMAAKEKRPGLEAEEELAHFREVIRRWEAKTGKSLRATLDPLKAEVAARAPGGPAFHPDFQKRFASAFDDLIPIEVEEIRERRNRAIHERVRPLFDQYRATNPELVRYFEDVLNKPPYNAPAAAGESPAGPSTP